MGWDFPIYRAIFGNAPGEQIVAWWNQYQWIVYIVIILVVLLVAALIWRGFK